MRKRFLDEFDAIWLDCLNGDSRETGKLTPEGKADPSVFSTEWNREGIRVGTAISLFVKRSRSRNKETTTRFRHFWGTTKRADLLASIDTQNFDSQYEISNPQKENRWSLRPENVTPEYRTWPRVVQLCSVKPMLGLNENRGGALQDMGKDRLSDRIRRYLDPTVDWDAFSSLKCGLEKRAAGFDPTAVRKKVQTAELFSEDRIQFCMRRPFDNGWAYISDVSPLWNRSRPELRNHLKQCPFCLLTRPAGVASPEGVPFFATSLLGEQDSMRGHAYYFPARLKAEPGRRAGRHTSCNHTLPGMEIELEKITANLSPVARVYLASLKLSDPDTIRQPPN